VGGGGLEGQLDAGLAGVDLEVLEKAGDAIPAAVREHPVQGLEPLAGFDRIDGGGGLFGLALAHAHLGYSPAAAPPGRVAGVLR